MKTFASVVIAFLAIVVLTSLLRPQHSRNESISSNAAETKIITGADQTDLYLNYLKGKRIGMVVNQTSIIGNKSAVDSLHALGLTIKSIFGPEHGFRGNASNGAFIKDDVDAKTGIPVISI